VPTSARSPSGSPERHHVTMHRVMTHAARGPDPGASEGATRAGRCAPGDPRLLRPAMDPMPSKTVTGTQGAAAGAAATLVMTAVLEAGRRWAVFHTQAPTRIMTVPAGSPGRRFPGELVLTALAHLGYGASCGMLFALLIRRCTTASLPLGVGYGLLLWLAGYAVWVPAVGAVPPPQRDQPGRQLALIAGHLVYGAVLADALRRLRDGRTKAARLGGQRQATQDRTPAESSRAIQSAARKADGEQVEGGTDTSPAPLPNTTGALAAPAARERVERGDIGWRGHE
jgi:hypothetical protein